MHIEHVPNHGSKPTVLLRQTYREGGKVKKRTVGNLTGLPEEIIARLRVVLRGADVVPVGDFMKIVRSLPHGHVEAVLGLIKKLGLPGLIDKTPSRNRDLVVGMIAARLLFPDSKLATTRKWRETTLAEDLGISDADENELYAALDWLLERQPKIEQRLANRHFQERATALYDLSSSYFEGRCCPLAAYGYNRDRKTGKQQVNYGLMTTKEGIPIAISVYPGNTGDAATVADQVSKLKGDFQLSEVLLCGDRGMLPWSCLKDIKEIPGMQYVSALRSADIQGLLEEKNLQMSLFDRQNLAEISSPQYPGERLIACYNPFLAEDRKRTRTALLEATELGLAAIAKEAARRTQTKLSDAELGEKLGALFARTKMRKHFCWAIKNGQLTSERNQASIEHEERLDGLYVIRTSAPKETLSSEDCVRAYKALAQVERAFRSIKSIDLLIRPIFLYTEKHVRAHLFLCMLSFYVVWHLRQAWAPLLFNDEDLPAARASRDPVTPASPSASAKKKKLTKRSADDAFPLHSFSSLLAHLGTKTRNTVCFGKDIPVTTNLVATPTKLQEKALALLDL